MCRIDRNFAIKITDFGLSEDVFVKNYFRQGSHGEVVKLPIKWMAPESLSDGHFSEKSDVVSVRQQRFGVRVSPLFLCSVVIWSDNVGDIQWREGSISRH